MRASGSVQSLATAGRSSRMTGNPQAEATLQRQRGLVLPNAAAFTHHNFRFVDKHLATSGDLFPGASGPSPGVLETDDFVRSTNPGVTLKVRIVAVEEKAFQSVGLEHDRIGHSEPGAKALDGRFPRTVLS